MPELLQPALLLPALAGLLVPLLIHLWERRQGKRVLVGSLRWLETADDRRISRIRFSEWNRFLLRAAIIGAFALLIAEPFRKHPEAAGGSSATWVLVDPALQQDPLVRPALDSFNRRSLPVRLLATGFPETGKAPGAQRNGGYWSLLRELALRPDAPDSVLVIAQPWLREFRGPRPALPFVVKWITPSPAPPKRFPVEAWGGRAPRLLTAVSSDSITRFEWQRPGGSQWQSILNSDSVRLRPPYVLKVGIVYDPGHREEQEILQAALRVAGAYTGCEIRVRSTPWADWKDTTRSDWLFWLSGKTWPAAAAAHTVFYQPDSLVAGGVFGPGAHSLYLLRLPLLAGTAGLSSGDRLPRALIRLLLESQINMPASHDRRLLPETQAAPVYRPEQGTAPEKEMPVRELHLVVWLLLATGFLAERLWAGATKPAKP